MNKGGFSQLQAKHDIREAAPTQPPLLPIVRRQLPVGGHGEGRAVPGARQRVMRQFGVQSNALSKGGSSGKALNSMQKKGIKY